MSRPAPEARPGLLALGLATLLGLLAWAPGFQALDERLLGASLAASGGRPPRADVAVLLLDESAYAHWGGRVPRREMARVVRALTAAGAGALGFDFSYLQPDQDGPEALEVLADALRAHGRVVTGAVPLPRGASTGGSIPVERTLPSGPTRAPEYVRFAPQFGGMRDATALGTFALPVSPAGRVRAAAALVEAEGRRIPGLAVATWLQARGLPLEAVVQREDGLEVDGLLLPTDDRGALAASWRSGLQQESFLELWRAVDPETGQLDEATAARVRGRHFIVCPAWDFLADVGVLVTGLYGPQGMVHALLLSDLLDRSVLRTVPPSGLWASAVVMAVLAAALSTRLRGWRLWAAWGAVSVGSAWCAEAALRAGYWAGPLAPLLGGTVGMLAVVGSRAWAREAERRLVREAFGVYVSPAILEQLVSNPAQHLVLSGARRDVTVLFSDLVGFTALSNTLDPDRLIPLLREYLGPMTRIVVEHGGRVDKIMGDGILAVFGDPVSQEDHAGAAARAAVRMREELHALGAQWRARGLPSLQCRTGMASGEVYVGHVGAENSKLEYTVLGPVVNLGSRLEGKAPHGGILVSAECARRLEGRFELLTLPGLSLKGFEGEQEARLLLGETGTQSHGRRHVRVALRHKARVRVGEGPWWEAEVTNASVEGMFVEAPGHGAQAGDAVELVLPRGDRFLATVRWCTQQGLGLAVDDTGSHLRALFGLEPPPGHSGP